MDVVEGVGDVELDDGEADVDGEVTTVVSTLEVGWLGCVD